MVQYCGELERIFAPRHRDIARLGRYGKDVSSCDADTSKALLIIVTYNSHDALSDLVGSIGDFERDNPRNHVVVVENSSDYGVRDNIEANCRSDRIHVQVASRNDGFSPGVNLGYRLAKELWGDFNRVILLNPDVVSAGNVVCELANRAAQYSGSNVGVLGVVLREPGGGIDRGCARRVWNRRRFFSTLVGYDGLVRFLHTAPRNLTQAEIDNDQSDLAMVSGALMCIDSDLLEGGLDTILPMYLEDQEICMRSLSRGRSVHLYSDLEAVHVGGVSRKSFADTNRALRIMELVEAPVQCMTRLQGYATFTLRLTVLLGGILRFLAAPPVAAAKTVLKKTKFRHEVLWILDQQRLAIWFIRWAFNGVLHTTDVSLAEYFDEYSA